MVADRTGLYTRFIEEQGEYAAGRTFFSYAFAYPGPQDAMSGMSVSDFLWAAQRQVILDLAEKGPCVIVGRCANYHLTLNSGAIGAERCAALIASLASEEK